MTHNETARAGGEDLSPEEQAIQGIEVNETADEERKDFADEDADTAALAEGRVAPPAPSQDEPV